MIILSPADIQIKVFDSKIKIWNPGKLPQELSVEDLKKEHGSIPRNKLLAYVFYYAGLIEKWGSGTERIVELCAEHDLPEPEFREESGGLSLYFYKDVYNEEHLRKMGLNQRQIRGVIYAKKNEKITNTEYQELNECFRNTATNDLNDLLEKGILGHSGKKGRGSYYFIAH